MYIDVRVENKIAKVVGSPVIICGNSDYRVVFTFDDEWENLTDKTVRFSWYKNGEKQYTDVALPGSSAVVPILADVTAVYVGVFAGDLHTTTPAKITCQKSILCEDGVRMFKGAQGEPGKDGKDGAKGETGNSVFIRYSASADGANMTETWTSGQKYMGVAVAKTAPTEASAYTWAEFVGAKGDTGDSGGAITKLGYIQIKATDFKSNALCKFNAANTGRRTCTLTKVSDDQRLINGQAYTIKYSVDGGTTWQEATATAAEHSNPVAEMADKTIGWPGANCLVFSLLSDGDLWVLDQTEDTGTTTAHSSEAITAYWVTPGNRTALEVELELSGATEWKATYSNEAITANSWVRLECNSPDSCANMELKRSVGKVEGVLTFTAKKKPTMSIGFSGYVQASTTNGGAYIYGYTEDSISEEVLAPYAKQSYVDEQLGYIIAAINAVFPSAILKTPVMLSLTERMPTLGYGLGLEVGKSYTVKIKQTATDGTETEINQTVTVADMTDELGGGRAFNVQTDDWAFTGLDGGTVDSEFTFTADENNSQMVLAELNDELFTSITVESIEEVEA